MSTAIIDTGLAPAADSGRWSRLVAVLQPALLQESDRWFLWVPVLLGIGIAGYFGLDGPPDDRLLIGLGLLAVLLLGLGRAGRERSALAAAAMTSTALILLGAVLAHTRLLVADAPVLERTGAFQLTGRVVEVAPRQEGQRLLLDRLVIADLRPEARPERVRITVRRADVPLEPGDRIKVRARLAPPPGPALPGGFDFARQAWFEGLGATGWALGPIQRLEAAAEDWQTGVAQVRAAVAARFMAHAPGDSGAVAAALISGLRAGIGPDVWSDFQRSGLAHILSISGLHMALVAGTIFLAARWSLALIEPLALRVPVRKIAAAIALLGAAGYLLLAGNTPPTVRSFLMVAAGLLAIMLDRSPVSMRLLAWAAIVLLVLRPEALLGASFQLSFAAVLALVAVYEGGRLSPSPNGDRSWLEMGWLHLRGVAITTLVASLATTPFSAFHFQNVTTFGVLANLLAVPITTFWVMPTGLLALALMPLGLEGPVVATMALGVDLVLWTARTVAAFPAAAFGVPAMPLPALLLFAAGAVWMALWRRAWRCWGVVPMLAAVAVVATHRPPDIVATPWLEMIGVRTGTEGRELAVLAKDVDTITLESWERGLAADVTRLKVGQFVEREGLRCDRDGCIVRRGDRAVSLARTVRAVVEDCPLVDLVVSRVGPETCPGEGRLLGPRVLQRSGGIAVWLEADGPRVRTIADKRGHWPWSAPRGDRAAERD